MSVTAILAINLETILAVNLDKTAWNKPPLLLLRTLTPWIVMVSDRAFVPLDALATKAINMERTDVLETKFLHRSTKADAFTFKNNSATNYGNCPDVVIKGPLDRLLMLILVKLEKLSMVLLLTMLTTLLMATTFSNIPPLLIIGIVRKLQLSTPRVILLRFLPMPMEMTCLSTTLLTTTLLLPMTRLSKETMLISIPLIPMMQTQQTALVLGVPSPRTVTVE